MSLQALLRGVFDYSGLLPPSSLTLDEALKESAGLPARLSRPWLAGADFTAPAEILGALGPERLALAGWEPSRPFRLCVLGPPLGGRGSPDADAQREAAAAAASYGEGRLRLAVSYEAVCPAALLGPRASGPLEAVRRGLGGFLGGLYIEPDCPPPRWPFAVEGVFRFFDSLPSELRPGLKVRAFGRAAATRGPEGLDADTLALVVAGAVDRGLRLKASGGPAHALAAEGEAAGFLTLALAVRLRRALGPAFSTAAIRACLACRRPEELSFEEGAAWLEFRLDSRALAFGPGLRIASGGLRQHDDELCRLFKLGPRA